MRALLSGRSFDCLALAPDASTCLKCGQFGKLRPMPLGPGLHEQT